MYKLSVECCMEFNKNSSVVNVSDVLKKEFEKFVEIFKDGSGFDVDYQWYRRNVCKIKECIQRIGRKSVDIKKKLFECFSVEKWLSVEAKSRHSLFGCRECLKEKYREYMCLFLSGVKDAKAIQKAKKEGLYKEKASVIRKETVKKLEELNKDFNERFDCSFEEAALGLKRFESHKEKKDVMQRVKEDIQSNVTRKKLVWKRKHISGEEVGLGKKQGHVIILTG